MATRTTCSWCHKWTAASTCPDCGHRTDVPRSKCDCGACRRFEPAKDEAGELIAVGDEVEFLEPYQGFTGGTVAELLRGITGPMAGVVVAPGRTVGTLCRRLRKAK